MISHLWLEKPLILCGMVRSTVYITNLALYFTGSIPYDGVPKKEIATVHIAITCLYFVLAFAGIAFAIACLIFNFIYRNQKSDSTPLQMPLVILNFFFRLVKLASAKLNFLIGAGAIIWYLDTALFVIPVTSPTAVLVFCNLIVWLSSLGYSLCYGTIFVKMLRVFFIFKYPSVKKKVSKFYHLE